MAFRRVRKRWLVAACTLAASLAVHGVVSLLAMRFEPPDAERQDSTVEMELTTVAEPVHAVPDVVLAAPSASASIARDVTRHDARARPTAPVLAAAATITLTAIPAIPTPTIAANTVCTVRCDAGVPSLVLAPSAVALSAFGEDDRRETAEIASGAAAGAELSRYLGATANARPWVTERAPPELHRSADGSYVYSSRRLNARIAPDGTVAFGDRQGISIDGPSGPTRPEAGIGVMGSFDVSEAVMEANGQDPLRAERDWFMRGTEELRDRLTASAAHADGLSSLHALDRRLAAIVAAQSLSPATQRARIFDAWDDCETDEIGVRARDHIRDFAREHFPAGSALAYTTAELAAFNARRVSHERFAPYG